MGLYSIGKLNLVAQSEEFTQRCCVERLSNVKVFIEKVIQKVTFSEQEDFQKNKCVIRYVLQFSTKHIPHSALRPNRLNRAQGSV